MESSPELDDKIKEWAKTDPVCKNFLDNMPLLRARYMKVHVARTVKDCVVGSNAELTMMILKENQRKPIPMCSKCGKKICSDECGAEDYVDRQPRSYMGVDINYKGKDNDDAQMGVSIAPFKDDKVKPLEVDNIYLVKGVISSFESRGNKYVNIEVDEAEPYTGEKPNVESDDTKQETVSDERSDENGAKAVEFAEGLLKLFDGKIPSAKWESGMASYGVVGIKHAMRTLKIKESDGYMIQEDN